MKLDVLGLNQSVSRWATCQTVRPLSSAWSSGHFKIAPPQSSSAMPRCCLYQAASLVWSVVDLKKTPPMPVTPAMAGKIPESLRPGEIPGAINDRDGLSLGHRRGG